MKAIFIASLSNSSASGRQRLWAMQACGIETIVVNKDDWQPTKLQSFITNRLKLHTLLLNRKLGEHVVKLNKTHKPNIIWIEWCKELSIDIFEQLKAYSDHVKIISFCDDNPWGKRATDVWMWQNYFKVIPFFDIHVVKRNSDVDHINKLGGGKCYQWFHGIYTPLFKPAEPAKPVIYDVSFVGTCMDGRDKLIGFLLDKGVDIHVFGNKWRQRSDLPRKYPNNFHAAVEGDEYVAVIQQSKICLGLVSQSNEDDWTMRTYEVPGCAKLFLSVKTAFHESLFGSLDTLLLFADYEECLKNINYWLSDFAKRSIIEKNVYDYFISNELTLDRCMRNFIEEINKF